MKWCAKYWSESNQLSTTNSPVAHFERRHFRCHRSGRELRSHKNRNAAFKGAKNAGCILISTLRSSRSPSSLTGYAFSFYFSGNITQDGWLYLSMGTMETKGLWEPWKSFAKLCSTEHSRRLTSSYVMSILIHGQRDGENHITERRRISSALGNSRLSRLWNYRILFHIELMARRLLSD